MCAVWHLTLGAEYTRLLGAVSFDLERVTAFNAGEGYLPLGMSPHSCLSHPFKYRHNELIMAIAAFLIL